MRVDQQNPLNPVFLLSNRDDQQNPQKWEQPAFWALVGSAQTTGLASVHVATFVASTHAARRCKMHVS